MPKKPPAPDGKPATPKPKKIKASLFDAGSIPREVFAASKNLEAALGLPVWFLVQSGERYVDDLSAPVLTRFRSVRGSFTGPIALVIDSPGGSADVAYRLAKLLRDHCGGFVAVVPRYAKSAATLLCLGADEIIMSEDAELGPLDVQVFEADREGWESALDEVQSLDRLNAFALEAVDRHMTLLLGRSGMKIRTLLPEVHAFVGAMIRPLFEKLDTVHYTRMSRLLKVAEEYASRLLTRKYKEEEAKKIARHLVHNYPEHGFVIDHEEANSFGLQAKKATGAMADALVAIASNLTHSPIVGQLEEV